jgi:hypothetical protein
MKTALCLFATAFIAGCSSVSPQPATDSARIVEETNAKLAGEPRRPTLRSTARPEIGRGAAVRPAVLAEDRVGTANMKVEQDPRWKSYGAYLQRMIETVQLQWERLLIQSTATPVTGSRVEVKFVLDADGKVVRVADVSGTASEGATRVCVSAITDRAPYGQWTDDMRAVLGEQQELTFSFYYQ